MGTPVKKIKEIVVSELGGSVDLSKENNPIVNVELNDQQFDTAVLLAKQWFTAKKGFTVFRPLSIDPAISEYKMKDDVQSVLDVVFQVPTDVAAFFTLGFFDIIPYGTQNFGSIGAGLGSYSGFAQLISFTEQRKRVFSVEPEWFFEPQTKILHVMTRAGSVNNLVLVQAKLNAFDPANLADKDDYLFTRWVRAKCKEIVGRIRSKYDSMPAAGGTITLDGATLLAESKEEFEKLDAEIFASQGPDGLISG